MKTRTDLIRYDVWLTAFSKQMPKQRLAETLIDTKPATPTVARSLQPLPALLVA
jgi:hypothetical protein